MLRIIKFFPLYVIITGFFCFTGCDSNSGYKGGEVTSYEDVKKFNSFVEYDDSSIARHHGSPGPLIYRIKGRVYGRYLLQLNFNYKVANSKGLHHPESNFQVSLMESNYKNGKMTSKMLGKINYETWKAIDQIDDLFKVLNITPTQDKDIEMYLEQNPNLKFKASTPWEYHKNESRD